jgi:hypothetical protein
MLNRFTTTSSILGLLICLLSTRECNGQFRPFATDPSESEFRDYIGRGESSSSMTALLDNIVRRSRVGCAQGSAEHCSAVRKLLALEKDVIAIDRRCKQPYRGDCLAQANAIRKRMVSLSPLS